MSNRWLTEKQVSQITGFSLSTLQNHRSLRIGLEFAKFASKNGKRGSVRYLESTVLDWMESHVVQMRNSE